jgi:hypothetical protein
MKQHENTYIGYFFYIISQPSVCKLNALSRRNVQKICPMKAFSESVIWIIWCHCVSRALFFYTIPVDSKWSIFHLTSFFLFWPKESVSCYFSPLFWYWFHIAINFDFPDILSAPSWKENRWWLENVSETVFQRTWYWLIRAGGTRTKPIMFWVTQSLWKFMAKWFSSQSGELFTKHTSESLQETSWPPLQLVVLFFQML